MTTSLQKQGKVQLLKQNFETVWAEFMNFSLQDHCCWWNLDSSLRYWNKAEVHAASNKILNVPFLWWNFRHNQEQEGPLPPFLELKRNFAVKLQATQDSSHWGCLCCYAVEFRGHTGRTTKVADRWYSDSLSQITFSCTKVTEGYGGCWGLHLWEVKLLTL